MRPWSIGGLLCLCLLAGMVVVPVQAQRQPTVRRPRTLAPPPPVQTPDPEASYRYEAQGQRDPFEPLLKPEPLLLGDELRPKPRTAERPAEPLERYDLSSLKLVGIVWGELGRKALIKAPDNKSYFVTLETYMGKYSGRVITIENDHLVIEEEYLNVEDKIVPKTLTIPLRRKDKKEG